MSSLPAFLSQMGNFSERFEVLEANDSALGLLRGRVQERETGEIFQFQMLLAPSHEDDSLLEQFEVTKGVEQAALPKFREWWLQPQFSVLLSEDWLGDLFSKRSEIYRDEQYLVWLRQGLEALAALHARGILHLGQGEFSWQLRVPDPELGNEAMFLSDLSLWPRRPLSGRVRVQDLFAIAPEWWSPRELDVRADLYSLACLILRQRSGRLFDRFDSVSKLLELHLGGRIAELVPKTASPLNELLRKMLQLKPEERPASAQAILREHFGSEIPESDLPSPMPSRVAQRRASMSFSCLWTLLQDGQMEMFATILSSLPAELSQAHVPYLAYLELYRDRHLDPASIKSVSIPTLNEVQDPELRVLDLLESAAFFQHADNPAETQSKLDQAWVLAKALPQAELQGRVLLKRARFWKTLGKEEEAIRELQEAYRRSQGHRLALQGIGILSELGDVWMQQGLAAASLMWREALALAKDFPQEIGRLHLGAAVAELSAQDFAAAATHFTEAKSFFSARKDVERLVHVLAHELRLFLAQGEDAKTRRELKILRSRTQKLPELQRFLDWLEVLLWLTSGEYVEISLEDFLEREGTKEGSEIFRELGWGPQDSLDILSRVARRLGREEEAASLQENSQALKDLMLIAIEDVLDTPAPEAFAAPVEASEDHASEAPSSEESHRLRYALETAQVKRDKLEAENRELKRRLEKISAKPERAKVKSSAPIPEPRPLPETRPTPPPAKNTDLAQQREAVEKKSIVDALQRNKGNREATASELKIHRRTLFAKMEKYGLLENTFMPEAQQILDLLQECGGKKNEVAKRLGMSRSTFYRHLKNLGIG